MPILQTKIFSVRSTQYAVAGVSGALGPAQAPVRSSGAPTQSTAAQLSTPCVQGLRVLHKHNALRSESREVAPGPCPAGIVQFSGTFEAKLRIRIPGYPEAFRQTIIRSDVSKICPRQIDRAGERRRCPRHALLHAVFCVPDAPGRNRTSTGPTLTTFNLSFYFTRWGSLSLSATAHRHRSRGSETAVGRRDLRERRKSDRDHQRVSGAGPC